MQQFPTLSKTNGDGVAEDKMVFGRNTIPGQYMDLVHEKFTNQKQKVKENVTKLRKHIQNTSIESEEGQLAVFRANKAMKAEMEYYKTLNKRQENSMNLTREYMAAESIAEKEIFEDAMRLEIEAMTMMKQQQKHDDHQSSDITTNNKSTTTTTTTTTTPTTTTTATMKKKKNKQSMFRKARSQLTLTNLQKSYLTLKKQQREETKQEQQDSDTTASTHSNSSASYFRPEDDGAPSPPSPSLPTPAPMMKRAVSFSNYTNVKRVPSVLDLLGGQCEASNAKLAKDNIWYDKTDFCGFAQKEMSRRSDLGITSTSALHSNVGRSDNDCESDSDNDGDNDDNDNDNDSDDSRRSYDNNECDYLRNRTNPNRMINRTNNHHRNQ